MRVVSVLPSATEIVCALGRRSALVGRSAECDYPAEVRDLPVVMRSRAGDVGGSSAEIDARVRASLARGEGLYELDVPLLARLRPDLILTQDLCRVCSVTDGEVEEACRSAGVAPRILSLAPTRLNEVWSSVERIAEALGVPEAGARLAESLRRGAPEPTRPAGPKVAVLEWLDPPIESGLWTPDVVASAGGTSWSAAPGGLAPTLRWEQLEEDPPSLAILSPCAFPVERTVHELASGPIGARLRAWRVRCGVWIADEAYFSRPGPRLAEGRRLVADLLEGRGPRDPRTVVPWAPAASPEAS